MSDVATAPDNEWRQMPPPYNIPLRALLNECLVLFAKAREGRPDLSLPGSLSPLMGAVEGRKQVSVELLLPSVQKNWYSATLVMIADTILKQAVDELLKQIPYGVAVVCAEMPVENVECESGIFNQAALRLIRTYSALDDAYRVFLQARYDIAPAEVRL